MKYSKQHREQMEAYSKKLNLPQSLIHVSMTRYQADTLNQCILDCLSYSDHIKASKERDLNDPTREYEAALKAQETLSQYLHNAGMVNEWMALNRIVIPDNDHRQKPQSVLAEFKSKTTTQLLDAGFSNTAIKTTIMPALRQLVKDSSDI